LLALAGGLFAAVYLSIGARVRTHMSTPTYTGVCYAVCSVVLLLGCLVGRVPLAGYPVNAWLKIVLVTICAQLLGHTLLNVVLRSTSPTVISLAILLEVPGAAIVAYLWLGQHPPWSAIPGLVLLLGGLGLVARARAGDVPVEITE
jgi:drug/metabolite transporter (DMT)-like permease